MGNREDKRYEKGKHKKCEVQLEKKLLKVENVVGENVNQAEVQNDIDFPVKVKKIWDVDAEVRDVDTEIIPDKVIVTGTIKKQIYYVAGEDKKVDDVHYKEGEVFEMKVEEDFTEFVEVPGATEDMDAHVDVTIEYVNHEKVDCDEDHHDDDHHDDRGGDGDHHKKCRFRQTVVLEIFVKVFEVVQMEIVTDVTATGVEIDVTKELLKVDSVVGEQEKQTEVINDIDFPDRKRARKVKEVISEIQDVSTKIIPDKVIVEGTLHKQIIFVEAETNRVFETSVDEPFTVSVEIPGAKEDDDVRVDVDVEFVDVELRDGDRDHGFRRGRQTAILDVFVKVTEALQIEVVTDVTGEGVDVTRDLLRVQAVVGENERQVNLRNDITFDRPIKKVLETATDVRIRRRDTKVINDKAIVEGVLKKSIFYVDLCHEGVFEKTVREEFTTFVDIPGAKPDQTLDVDVDVEHIDYNVPDIPDWACGAYEDGEYNPDDYPVKQTAVLQVFAKVTESVQMDVVVDVTCAEDQDDEDQNGDEDGCIKIVIIQRGDTYWTLSRKYHTTEEAIMEANPGVDSQNLQIGQQIRIPCSVKGAKG